MLVSRTCNLPQIAIYAKALKTSQFMALKESIWDWDNDVRQLDYFAMFRAEDKVLTIMRDLKHDHLIEYVTSFTISFTHFLVFPWADAGNLREFWFQDDDRRTSPECITWFIEQLTGLFDGIKELHSKCCMHGDIKPENLLLFPQHGTWPRIVISDFGLARAPILPTIVRKANNEHTKTTWRTPMYEAPESEDPESKDLFSPRSSHDIWQIGCVSLELLIWLLWGQAQGLALFSNLLANAPFWKVSSDIPIPSTSPRKIVHPSVLATMQWLRKQDFRCAEQTAVGDILHLIMRKLLEVELDCGKVVRTQRRCLR